MNYKASEIRESVANVREGSRALAPVTGEQGNRGTGEVELPSSPAAPATDDLTSKRITIDTEFDAWWAVYPRKVSKGHALKAYRSARRKTDAATLLAALQQQAPALKAKGTEFCPHAATWLNGERWADDTAPLVTEPQRDHHGRVMIGGGW